MLKNLKMGNRGIIPILGGIALLPLLGLILIIGLGLWLFLQTVVPILLLLGLVGAGLLVVFKGFQSTGTFKIGRTKIPQAFPLILFGGILLLVGLFMFKPTAGFALSVGSAEMVQSGVGVFESGQLFSIMSAEDTSLSLIPETVQSLLLISALFVYGLILTKRLK